MKFNPKIKQNSNSSTLGSDTNLKKPINKIDTYFKDIEEAENGNAEEQPIKDYPQFRVQEYGGRRLISLPFFYFFDR